MKEMRNLILGMAVMGGLAMASTARASLEGSDVTIVRAQVTPHVSVTAQASDTQIGDIQWGESLTATLFFTVDSNNQNIELAVCASDLYKGGFHVGALNEHSIPVNPEVTIDPALAGPAGEGGSLVHTLGAPGPGQPADCLGFPVLCTAPAEYENSIAGKWDQETVLVSVTWDHTDPAGETLPEGEYWGVVKLIALVIDSTPAPAPGT